MYDTQYGFCVSRLSPEDIQAIVLSGEWRNWDIQRKTALLHRLRYDFSLTARPEQVPPDDDSWDVFLYLAGRATGKGIAVDTRVPTPDGFKRYGDLSVGDHVLDHAGRPTVVEQIFDYTPTSLYRLTFDDGSFIDCDGDHLWTTWTHLDRKAFAKSPKLNANAFDAEWPAWNRATETTYRSPKHESDRGPKTRDTQEIAATVMYDTSRETCPEHSIPNALPLALQPKMYCIDPYVYGLWLGDGSKSGGWIATSERDADDVSAELVKRGYDSRIVVRDARSTALLLRSDRLHAELTMLGIRVKTESQGKPVDEAYAFGSYQQRLDCLRGLMDADGCRNIRGRGVVFANTREDIARFAYVLVCSLGGKASIKPKPSHLNGVRHKDCWQVTFTLNTANPFCLPQKAEWWSPAGKQWTRTSTRQIVSVEPLPISPVRCITIDAQHALYLIGDQMVPTHNTRSAMEFAKREARRNRGTRIALIGQTYGAAREVALDGESGLIAITPPREIEKYNTTRGLVTFKNSSQLSTYSGADPEKLRGPQFHVVIFDELAAYQRDRQTYDMATFALRLGNAPKKFIATTPKPTKLLQELLKEAETNPRIIVVRGSTFDNAANLPRPYLDGLLAQYDGTDLGRQELYGQMLSANANALWQQQTFEDGRVVEEPTKYTRKVIAVDPAVTSGVESDETGIIVGGVLDKIYIVEDLSQRTNAAVWSKAVVDAYWRHKCDAIIVENNQGGEAWEVILKQTDPRVNVKETRAVLSKKDRATPCAHLYQRGQVSHVGTFGMLESQCITWDPDNSKKSPDRIDALSWCVLDLSTYLRGGGYTVKASGMRV